jgi:hypothetical protein
VSTRVDKAADNKVRIAVGVSIVSLLMSGLSLFFAVTDDVDVDNLERRLACLELPGANDCGPDR